jgi:MFS family permease
VPVIVGSQFAPTFMFSGVAVALPSMGADLNAGATSLGLVESLFLAASVAFLLPVGRIADATDRGMLYKLGLLGFGVSSVLIGAMSSMPVILMLRFVQGIASAITAATGPALLAQSVPPERRGRAFGASLGAVYAGLTLGPVCAGVLIDQWGWRAVFWAGGALLLLAFLMTTVMLHSQWRRPAAGTVHLPSTVLVAGAMLALVLGSALMRRAELGYACMAAGFALAAAFIVLQRRLPRPLLDVSALNRNKVMRTALLIQVLLYTNAFCSIFMLSIYMQIVLGESANSSGQVLAIATLLMALVAPLSGFLSDRYRPGKVASLGVALVLGAVGVAMTLDERSSLAHVGMMLALQGLGFAFFSTPNMTIIMNSVSSSAASMASALTAMARSLGMVSGMLITAALISLKIGDEPLERHAAEFLATMQIAFAALSVLTVIALALSLRSRRR